MQFKTKRAIENGISLLANLRTLKQMNDQGVNMSPRDQPPSVETRFEATNDSFQSPRTSAVTEASPMMQAAGMSRHYRFAEPYIYTFALTKG